MNAPTVFVVDDDAAVRDSLSLLLETAGLPVECFDSAEAFLAADCTDRPGCLVLDLRMGGMGGMELQSALVSSGSLLTVIFLTAHGDIPTTVRAIKAGAADFLTKPVDGSELIDRVDAALRRNREQRERDQAERADRARLGVLTPREWEVLRSAIAGQSNKEIARTLGISHRTVEFHRSRILSKTGAGSLLELAQIAAAGPQRDNDAG